MRTCLLLFLICSFSFEKVDLLIAKKKFSQKRKAKYGIPLKKQPITIGGSNFQTKINPHKIVNIGANTSPLIIGSFNIQSFGTRKMNRPDVVDVLVQVKN